MSRLPKPAAVAGPHPSGVVLYPYYSEAHARLPIGTGEYIPRVPAVPKLKGLAAELGLQLNVWRSIDTAYVEGLQYFPSPRDSTDELELYRAYSDWWQEEYGKDRGYSIDAWARYAASYRYALFAAKVLRAPWPDAEVIIATDESAIEVYSRVFARHIQRRR